MQNETGRKKKTALKNKEIGHKRWNWIEMEKLNKVEWDAPFNLALNIFSKSALVESLQIYK